MTTRARQRSWAGSACMALLLVGVMLTGVLVAHHVAAANASGPAAPGALTVQNDDHVATVSWGASPDSATVGYKVSWGPTGGNTTAHTFFTPYTVAQVQPLDDGVTYQVSVQSVDQNGGLSSPTAAATVQTDPTYVNGLRQQMTGQFDDFNTNPYQGEVDPTHWYTSYNNASARSMPFVFEAQHHLHLFLENNIGVNGDDDRGSMTQRALRPFDFTGRTGTIAFDFDWARNVDVMGGVTGRFQWYLTVSPTRADDVNYDAGGEYPRTSIQLKMDRDVIFLDKIVGGQIVQEWRSGDIDPILRTINVRRHSVFTLSQDAALLTIEGQTILTASGLGLSFTRGWVYNQQFQYNLRKDHVPFALTHWDNIGFDAPASGYTPDVLHEYTDGSSVNSDRLWLPAKWTVPIADDLTGATSERLIVDAWGQGGATPSVMVNGVAAAWPDIGVSNDNVAFDARVVELPVGTLHQGVNTIAVNGTGWRIQNVHAEVSFPFGSTAPYTPAVWPMASSDPMAMIPAVAPLPGFGLNTPSDGATVSGVVPVEVTADGSFALLPTGHVNAVTRVSVDVDGVPTAVYTLPAPTVSTDHTLLLDTTLLSNGTHTITVTATGMDLDATSGAPATLNTLDSLLKDWEDAAVNRRVLTISNTGIIPPSPSPTATATPLPTMTPPPTSTPPPTPISLNNTPCTVTLPDGTQQTGTCSGTFQP